MEEALRVAPRVVLKVESKAVATAALEEASVGAAERVEAEMVIPARSRSASEPLMCRTIR